MVLDEFASQLGEDSSSGSGKSNSTSSSSDSSESKHGKDKLGFNTPYFEVRKYGEENYSIHVGISETKREGEFKEPRGMEYESIIKLNSKHSFDAFRDRCRREHGVDVLDIARSDYSFRGFIEDLNNIPDEASNAELLVWLYENTWQSSSPKKKSMCDICGQSGAIDDGDLTETWITDKDVVSRDQTRVVSCEGHSLSDVLDAVNAKRKDEGLSSF